MKLTTVLEEIADMERVEFENLHRHGYFSKSIKAKNGRFDLTPEQAFEVASTAALCRVGYKPSVARDEVASWVKQYRDGRLEPMWAANPRRPLDPDLGLGVAYSDRSIGFDDMARADPDDEQDTGYRDDKFERSRAAKPAIQIVFIDRGEIVRRIKKLFAEAESA